MKFIVSADRIPAPAQASSARVEGSDHATSHVNSVVVIDRRAHDYEIIEHRRRGGHVISASGITWHIAKGHLAILAKSSARRPSGCVERNKARIQCRFVNPAAAWSPGPPSGHRIEPSRNTTIDERVAIVPPGVDLRIVGPSESSRFRIQCNHAIEARREE
jgi:hypothetical protein